MRPGVLVKEIKEILIGQLGNIIRYLLMLLKKGFTPDGRTAASNQEAILPAISFKTLDLRLY